jgi:ferrous iron transport protein A
MSVAAVPDTLTLDRLPIGHVARIARLSGDPSRVIRLMELGLMQGETVEMLGAAPLGDPLAIRIGGCRLALRRHEAALIDVDAGSP